MSGYSFTMSVTGTLRGRIWMPPIESEKEFCLGIIHVHNKKYTAPREFNTLREVILEVTNDGDFQNCDILADGVLTVVLHKSSNKHVIRNFDLNSGLFSSIQDCLLDDYPI